GTVAVSGSGEAVKHVSNGIEKTERARFADPGAKGDERVRSAGLAKTPANVPARHRAKKAPRPAPEPLRASDLADQSPGELDPPSLAGRLPPRPVPQTPREGGG